MNNTVRDIEFYEPHHAFGYLSNFADYAITLDDREWQTTEHYYQANKFTDPDIRTRIADASSPAQAFQLSRDYADNVRPDWQACKLEVMKKAVTAKFQQHPKLAFWLVATGDSIIKEHSSRDEFWGDGGDGHGQNQLGKILMQIRKQLADTPTHRQLAYIASSQLPTRWGQFNLHGFEERSSNQEHAVLSLGQWSPGDPVLIRIHSECLTGDAFASLRCDCGNQLDRALREIALQGRGLLIYLRQEGRGIGLLNKIRAYHLQDLGADTAEANQQLGLPVDARRYDFVQCILKYFSVNKVRLMTNNPEKIQALQQSGIEVVERLPIEEGHNPDNDRYLRTKIIKFGHMLNLNEPAACTSHRPPLMQ